MLIIVQDDLALSGDKREKMYKLPVSQKRYLIKQHLETHSGTLSRASGGVRNINHAAQASTFSPGSGSGIIPKLVPQLTGDTGFMKRFSIAGWAASTSPPESRRSSAELPLKRHDTGGQAKIIGDTVPETTPIVPQSTGGLWSSWWTSSGGDKAQKDIEKTPKWYADGIRSDKPADIKLVKHLISLRVHISTANLAWVEEFVDESQGIDALGKLLSSLVAKGGKRRKLREVEETVLLETIKCVRVLLNTDVSMCSPSQKPTFIFAIIAWFQERSV